MENKQSFGIRGQRRGGRGHGRERPNYQDLPIESLNMNPILRSPQRYLEHLELDQDLLRGGHHDGRRGRRRNRQGGVPGDFVGGPHGGHQGNHHDGDNRSVPVPEQRLTQEVRQMVMPQVEPHKSHRGKEEENPPSATPKPSSVP